MGKNLSVEYENIDIGAVYRVNAATRLGLMFKNLIGFSYNDKYRGFATPKYATIAISHTKNQFTFSLDNEYIYGNSVELKSIP